jgi:hypothetical protein
LKKSPVSTSFNVLQDKLLPLGSETSNGNYVQRGLLVDTVDVPAITNKIYDIKVADEDDSDTSSPLHYEFNVYRFTSQV